MCARSREADRLAKVAEEQGFRTRRTRKGYVVYSKDPDGPCIGWHRTPSDHRSMKNTIADLRRIGVEVSGK